MAKTDVDLNPFYRDQKQIFIYILNIFSFYYSYLAQKCKDKEKCDNYTTMSTSFVNQAENISMYDPMTVICKGFLFFVQGDYDNSETYFANIDDDKHSNLNKYILILAKLGRALNLFNKSNYSKAADNFISLIRDFDFINENILESLAICYYNLGKVNKAKNIFKKIFIINENNFKSITYLAIIDLTDITKNPVCLDSMFIKLKQAYIMDGDSEFHFLLITIANLFLACGKINEAEEICSKLNTFLEYGEMKSSRKQGKEKHRKDFDDIKSAIYCVNAKIHHIRVK
jgi:tetratricopeptide (TPR) repeat protein